MQPGLHRFVHWGDKTTSPLTNGTTQEGQLLGSRLCCSLWTRLCCLSYRHCVYRNHLDVQPTRCKTCAFTHKSISIWMASETRPVAYDTAPRITEWLRTFINKTSAWCYHSKYNLIISPMLTLSKHRYKVGTNWDQPFLFSVASTVNATV